MKPTQLLDHFDRISEAPDAIPRLRRFILDLAVRGKLVEQDQRDEPASELLKRIQEEKARLVREGEIRAPRDLEAGKEDEDLYRLPTQWTWCRLSEVGAIVGGGTPPSGDLDNFTDGGSGIAWLTPADLGKHVGLYVSHGVRDLTEQGLRSSSATLMPKGSVLFTSRAPIGYTAIAANEVSTNQGFKSVLPFIPDCNLYIAVYFHAFGKRIDSKASGTTFREVSGKIVANLPFPLPPLAEQQRIVAKVDELMALCDRLEAAQVERENRRDRLAAASLNRLNQPTDEPSAFQDYARFYFNHIPRLTTRPEHIKQLRQTILNLAVRGQLVPQNAKDIPAPMFGIEQGTEETNRIQLQLPLGWSWARVEDVAESRLGKMLDKAKNSGNAYQYLRNTNVHWFNIRMDELKQLRIDAREVEKYVLRNGDVLICEGGHGIGRTAVWRGMETDIVFQKALHRVRPGQALNSEFFAYCVSVYFHAGVLHNYFTGVGIPHFTGVALSKLVFPLPPLAEQHRIVEKVDELMSLCDRLEAQLTTTHTESRRLLEAVLQEALAPAV